MKLEKLLCLKYLGKSNVENLWESQTMKLFLASLQDTMESVEGSSTISKVLVRNGGGPTSCRPSIGCAEKLGDEGDDGPGVPPSSFAIFSSMQKQSSWEIEEKIIDLIMGLNVLGCKLCREA